mmetsp:Transcript_44172/g.104562  ORF Transcript_44172/g.104562 Transcript_44172/m.104562 type:complete len:858 (-) Transcript_44172:253-2826(-)|eukprot:CAMPEP_0178392336 /NCGR_PEP_ID=MMETSP0689_2-20121128/11627_1 /TAXON_ID=160604 /ORGANISM="Amphidinium massartii, Strain CS-259" /LENGTH=857 /DNA_ID=CAMNT_0020012909 /DNA_START=96 /DNA_END=2669 /DNA_ORIENTATION=+
MGYRVRTYVTPSHGGVVADGPPTLLTGTASPRGAQAAQAKSIAPTLGIVRLRSALAPSSPRGVVIRGTGLDAVSPVAAGASPAPRSPVFTPTPKTATTTMTTQPSLFLPPQRTEKRLIVSSTSPAPTPIRHGSTTALPMRSYASSRSPRAADTPPPLLSCESKLKTIVCSPTKVVASAGSSITTLAEERESATPARRSSGTAPSLASVASFVEDSGSTTPPTMAPLPSPSITRSFLVPCDRSPVLGTRVIRQASVGLKTVVSSDSTARLAFSRAHSPSAASPPPSVVKEEKDEEKEEEDDEEMAPCMTKSPSLAPATDSGTGEAIVRRVKLLPGDSRALSSGVPPSPRCGGGGGDSPLPSRKGSKPMPILRLIPPPQAPEGDCRDLSGKKTAPVTVPSPRSGHGVFRPGDKVIFWSEDDGRFVEGEVKKAEGCDVVVAEHAERVCGLGEEVEVPEDAVFWVPAFTPSAAAREDHARRVCPHGVYCPHRSKLHLQNMAHPFDRDYCVACEDSGIEALEPSLWLLFQWLDYDNSGKVSHKEFADQLPLMSHLMGNDHFHLSRESFMEFDKDGNNYLNFTEFTAWAEGKLKLPLGLEHLGLPVDGTVPFPKHWQSQSEGQHPFVNLVQLGEDAISVLQGVVDRTYSSAWTRDRRKHNPSSPNVPKGFKVTKAFRSENSRVWRSYCVFRASCLQERRGHCMKAHKYQDIKTVVAFRQCATELAADLSEDCNEWYLWHGTRQERAQDICHTNFRMNRCGESTGTLYGNGTYFSESITKADEYAKPNEDGEYCVLLCRLIGGNVRYTDEIAPDPDAMTRSCMEGEFDSVLGDRERCRGTYREFVFFDSEHIYPEYVVYYRRLV